MLRDRLAHAALVVAHPDDEILWFSSIVTRVKTVIVCFMEVPGQPVWSAGRRAVADAYPLPNARFLGLTESMAFQGADWAFPEESPVGLKVERRSQTLPEFDAGRYVQNFATLAEALGRELHGHTDVITHNPWGEYGHEEHVQVHKAVRRVAQSSGLDVWYSNYCSDRSYALMLRHVDRLRAEGETFSTNIETARCLESLYRQHGCWTWPFDDYPYFSSECFFHDDGSAGHTGPGTTVALNFIRLKDPLPRPSVIRRALRRIRRHLQT